MLDLSEVKWSDVVIPNTRENASRNTKQTSLSDFLNEAGSCLLSLVTYQIGVVIIRFIKILNF